MGLGGFFKGLGKAALNVGSSLIPGGSLAKNAIKAGVGAAGSAIGSASQAAASNRGTMLDALMAQQQLRQQQTRDYNDAALSRAGILEGREKRMFDQLLAREREGRESGKDALKSMQHASYIASGGNEFKGGNAFGFGPRATTAAERQGAEGFKAELMRRLEGGNQVAMPERGEDIAAIERQPEFTLDPKLMKPGTMEKIGGIVGPGLTMWELLRRQGNTGINGGTHDHMGRVASAPNLTFLPQSPRLQG